MRDMIRHICKSRLCPLVAAIITFFASLALILPWAVENDENAGVTLVHSLVSYDCKEARRALPVWSRASTFIHKKDTIFESGSLSDVTYFGKRRIADGSIIYVASADVPQFIRDHFLKLPQHVRVVLVSGAEDIGQPWETFHLNRTATGYKREVLWGGAPPISLRQFLADPRLHKWFVQNYDLVGCNYFTCSDMNPATEKALIEKVVPMPIGVDLHTLAEKDKKLSPIGAAKSVCTQRVEIEKAILVGKDVKTQQPVEIPFQKRRVAALGEFDCNFNKKSFQYELRLKTRGELCRLLIDQTKGASNSSRFVYNSGTGNKKKVKGAHNMKLRFWNEASQYQFGFAPTGMGTDTHRVWELLLMKTVPIVMSSPLDRLYSEYPVVIVKQWSDVFTPGTLEKYRDRIVARFGKEPFNAEVQRKLTGDYWVELIRSEKPVAGIYSKL